MTEKNIETTTLPNSWHMIRALGGIGVLCAVLIVMTYELTLPAIIKNNEEFLNKAIYKVLPGATSKKVFYSQEDNTFAETPSSQGGGKRVFAGYDKDDNFVGLALETQAKGYAGAIKIIYGYKPDIQAVIGIRVLESKETPGLGDKIEKDEQFLKNFIALDVSINKEKTALKNPIVMVKSGKKSNDWEIDAITGATISSKAITKMLKISTDEWIAKLYNDIEKFTKK